MQSIFFALVLAANPPAVPEEQQRPPVVPSMPPVVPMPTSQYEQSASRAVAAGKPLVVFVGVDARPISGAVVCQVEALAGHPDPRIVVSVPANGWLAGKATLAATATDADIQQAIRPAVSQQAAAPFAERDADLPDAVASIVAGLERYLPAKNTQSVANGNQISKVSRTALEPHWQVPAGMVGLTGWRSDLFRNPTARPRTWRANIELWNGGYWSHMGGGTVYENGRPKKSYQPEQAYLREYPDGARFVDVRSTAKGVFEAFVREKAGGVWYSSVDYENHAARPVGYKGLTQSCGSCHSKAGTGGYAVGWVPGGDGVLSDPISQLE